MLRNRNVPKFTETRLIRPETANRDLEMAMQL